MKAGERSARKKTLTVLFGTFKKLEQSTEAYKYSHICYNFYQLRLISTVTSVTTSTN
jgi:hypothetical protein